MWNYYDGWGCVACYHSLAKEEHNIAQTTGTYWCTCVYVCMCVCIQAFNQIMLTSVVQSVTSGLFKSSATWEFVVQKKYALYQKKYAYICKKRTVCVIFYEIVDKLCFRRRPGCHFSCIIHYFTRAYTAFLCISTGKELHPKFLHTPQYINESGECWWFLFAARTPWVSGAVENRAYLRHTPMPCV